MKSRWYLWAVPIFLVLALSAGGLALAGRKLPPPQFRITRDGLLEPLNYPAWRRTSDWLAQRKYIMLTFDDGPYGRGVDEDILSILAAHRAHAVFFEVCAHIDAATQRVPGLILATGNMLGNHTYHHRHLPKLGASALQQEIAGCSAKLATVTGIRPTLFRPPWGQLSPAAIAAIHKAGMQPVLWDANSEDTWLKSPKEIIRMSLYEASLGGHILLMHSKPTTATALGPLLTELQKRGFQFVLPTVSGKSSNK